MLMNDWMHFNKILNTDPIDTNQLDVYLYFLGKQTNNNNNNVNMNGGNMGMNNMSNMNNNSNNSNNNNNSPPYNLKSPPERQSTSNISDFNINKFSKKPTTTDFPLPNNTTVDKKNTITGSVGSKRYFLCFIII
jgi:hypothetical protein